ncbi:MAG: response regulator [Proteobacteria bacterium]|nr:response regulator [Pseudomonadota bacterium]
MSKEKILIVEDEVIIAIEIETILKRLGYHVFGIANSGKTAIQKTQREQPDLILMDIKLKDDMNGIETADIIRSEFPIPIVFLTAYADEETLGQAKLTLPFGYLLKPVRERELQVVIEMALYSAKITDEQRRTEESLRQSEHYLKEAQAMAHLGHWKLNPETQEVSGSDELFRIFGLGREENLLQAFVDVVHPEDREDNLFHVRRGMEEGIPYEIEHRLICRDGTEKIIHTKGGPVTDENGKVVELLGIVQDITQRKKSEGELKWESEINSALADVSAQLIHSSPNMDTTAKLILEHAQKITSSNHGFVSVVDPNTGDNTGYTLSQTMGEQCNVEDASILFSVGSDGKYDTLRGHALNTHRSFYTNRRTNHPGSKGLPEGHVPLERLLAVPVVINNILAGQIAVANPPVDYTGRDLKAVEQLGELFGVALQRGKDRREREELERQLQQMQKLEAIGTLAGGIAHDFNNILQPIMGYASVGLRKTEGNPEIHEFFKAIRDAASRARELVRQILTFSRKSEQELNPMFMQPVVEEALKMLRSSLPTTIEIREDIDDNLNMVMSDATKIHQIVMNLATNAFHAMQDTGGQLEVSLNPVDLNTDDPGEIGLPPGPYACLTVSDTGTGMRPAVLGRIFDPYFTTKEKEKGTGLGLSVVMGIVKGHGGNIDVSSLPGRGSEFRVYLPRISNEEEPSILEEEKPEPGKNERILLVDDETIIVELEKVLLKQLGYRVTTQTSSIEALEIFKSRPQDFDLVITDMTMPHMTGDQLVKQLLSIRPDIPVILCTGFSENMDEQKAKALGAKELLMKPVDYNQFARSIRKALT